MGEINIKKGDVHDTPSAGYSKFYVKNDGIWYTKDEAGVEIAVTDALQVKCSSNDTTMGYLEDKIVSGVGTGIEKSTLNDGANEDVQIAVNISQETEKATSAVDDDLILIEDSEDTNNLKKIKIVNLFKGIPHLENTIIIGVNGDFATIKEGVDWFNTNATHGTAILLDGNTHVVSDTITVNNIHGVALTIRGLGSASTFIKSTTGLTNKPMFNIKTNCDVTRVTIDGSNLAGYGSLTNENAFVFDTNAGIYSELTDIIIDGFYTAIIDTIGCCLFIFNFIISNCTNGVVANSLSGAFSCKDLEIGNFENCDIGIDLKSATNANIIINACIFELGAAQVAIKYDGTNFLYDQLSIFNCRWNKTGTFLSGFDFTLVRDADIEIVSNIGIENKRPHAKINVVGNVSTTTITTAGTYYKAVFTNTNYYTVKMTIANNKATYQSTHPDDLVMWISGNVSANNKNRNVIACIVKNGVDTTQYGLFTVRTATANQPYGFSFSVYLQDVTKDDFFEIYLTSSTNGDVLTVQDVTWYIEAR